MPKHVFSALFAKYEAVIAQMPETFDSHQFILRLAQQHQTLYIEALYNYRHSPHRESPAPFRIVHQFLARHLSTCRGLVTRTGDVYSADIFGQFNECARWRKC
jgi:hypothetical protein